VFWRRSTGHIFNSFSTNGCLNQPSTIIIIIVKYITIIPVFAKRHMAVASEALATNGVTVGRLAKRDKF